MTSYLAAARHPWACLLFLLPLLAAYEAGVVWLGGANPSALRNGADAWLRWGLERYGFGQLYAAPAIVLGVFVLRAVAERKTRPKEPVATLFGMLVESAAFAVVLWAFSRNFPAILQQLGVMLNVPAVQFRQPAAAQLVTYVGAGIYEEVIFRLGLFSVAVFLLRLVLFPTVVAVPVAGLGAAVTFAAAHHVGANGEWPINPMVFAFRLIAGVYFTAIYVARGFGVAVGAHAGYDILVGVVVQPAAPGPPG
jgi:hypothetical protein